MRREGKCRRNAHTQIHAVEGRINWRVKTNWLNVYGGFLHETVEITSVLIVFSCNSRKLFWVADDEDDRIGTYRFLEEMSRMKRILNYNLFVKVLHEHHNIRCGLKAKEPQK